MKASLLVLLLAGCATVPDKPVLTRSETTVVKVPVAVPCVTADQVPKLPGTVLRADGLDDRQKVEGLNIDLQTMQDVAVRYEALLTACVKAVNPEGKK